MKKILLALIFLSSPVEAAISRVGGGSAATNSITIPAGHAANDLIIILACNRGNINNSIPALPAGYISLHTEQFTISACRLGYKIAASNTETSGTWTAADRISTIVYRGINTLDPFGHLVECTSTACSGSGANVRWEALTLEVATGSSWVSGFGWHQSSSTMEVAPTGMTNVTSSGTTGGETTAHDTNAGTTSWVRRDQNPGANSENVTYTIELLEGSTASPQEGSLFTLGVGI